MLIINFLKYNKYYIFVNLPPKYVRYVGKKARKVREDQFIIDNKTH